MNVEMATADELNPLLARAHYLGPLRSGLIYLVARSGGGDVVAGQVWRRPTSRRLPSDGTWLELSRWCLTPEAGSNAGSRFHRAALRLLAGWGATTLVSYSDPSVGHTGALYRACNWRWAPTWHRLRPPPTGNGSWDGNRSQSVKDRWLYLVAPDRRRSELCAVADAAAIRWWLMTATDRDLALAERSPAVDLRDAAIRESVRRIDSRPRPATLPT